MVVISYVLSVYSIIISVIGMINMLGIKNVKYDITNFDKIWKTKLQQNITLLSFVAGSCIFIHLVAFNSFDIMMLISILYVFFLLFVPVGIVTSLLLVKLFYGFSINKFRVFILFLSTTVPILDIFVIKMLKNKLI